LTGDQVLNKEVETIKQVKPAVDLEVAGIFEHGMMLHEGYLLSGLDTNALHNMTQTRSELYNVYQMSHETTCRPASALALYRRLIWLLEADTNTGRMMKFYILLFY
jgi:hypothetical protein